MTARARITASNQLQSKYHSPKGVRNPCVVLYIRTPAYDHTRITVRVYSGQLLGSSLIPLRTLHECFSTCSTIHPQLRSIYHSAAGGRNTGAVQYRLVPHPQPESDRATSREGKNYTPNHI